MEARIVEFTNLLRKNGVRVSPAEVMDGLRCSVLVGLKDRLAFKAALRAAMVKRLIDLAVFDEMFDLYFSGLGRTMNAIADETLSSLALSEEEFQKLMDLIAEVMRDQGVALSPLARALLDNDTGRLAQMLREAASAVGLEGIERPCQDGQYGYALAEALNLDRLRAELGRVKQLLQEKGAGSPDFARAAELVERRLDDLGDMVRRLVKDAREMQNFAQRDKVHLRSLAEKSFYYLTEDEVRRMKEAVTKLAQRLKNAISIRRKRARRGRVDIKTTLRGSLQYGGVPFKIRLDQRKRDKPQVVILCDVSDSVRNVSRFMLQFVYSLQDLYSRVRSFIFVADIGEITNLFEENDINRAIDMALRGKIINVFAHSDFGRSFRLFYRDYISGITHRTTVLILGDARNNYNVPHEWVLKEIKQRAKRVIWLNPESRSTWGFGDSEMERYMPYCDMVEECHNLKQLYGVIDRVVAS